MDKTTAILATLLAVVMVSAVVLLAWHGTVNGQAAMTFISSLTLVGVVGGVQHAATRAGARAATMNKDS